LWNASQANAIGEWHGHEFDWFGYANAILPAEAPAMRPKTVPDINPVPPG
jgi:hypothetical protein